MSTELSTYANQYVAKKAFFSFLGNTFRIFGTDGSLQFYVKQKAFKLREEIGVFHDEGQTQKRLAIQARGIGDFSGTYDISDAETGERLGAAKREGLKSMLVDSWILLDANDQPMGSVKEIGGFTIVLRKLFKFIPQKYEVRIGEDLEGRIHQRFSFFQLGYDVDFSPGSGKLDPRMGVGLTVLLLAIEGGKDG
ncbi:MAG: hypothetical protein H6741_13570 [Alphaproteobacteria bacterium]|nr:hypothetical protein [Alphaproteobacteria bacterium]